MAITEWTSEGLTWNADSIKPFQYMPWTYLEALRLALKERWLVFSLSVTPEEDFPVPEFHRFSTAGTQTGWISYSFTEWMGYFDGALGDILSASIGNYGPKHFCSALAPEDGNNNPANNQLTMESLIELAGINPDVFKLTYHPLRVATDDPPTIKYFMNGDNPDGGLNRSNDSWYAMLWVWEWIYERYLLLNKMRYFRRTSWGLSESNWRRFVGYGSSVVSWAAAVAAATASWAETSSYVTSTRYKATSADLYHGDYRAPMEAQGGEASCSYIRGDVPYDYQFMCYTQAWGNGFYDPLWSAQGTAAVENGWTTLDSGTNQTASQQSQSFWPPVESAPSAGPAPTKYHDTNYGFIAGYPILCQDYLFNFRDW